MHKRVEVPLQVVTCVDCKPQNGKRSHHFSFVGLSVVKETVEKTVGLLDYFSASPSCRKAFVINVPLCAIEPRTNTRPLGKKNKKTSETVDVEATVDDSGETKRSKPKGKSNLPKTTGKSKQFSPEVEVAVGAFVSNMTTLGVEGLRKEFDELKKYVPPNFEYTMCTANAARNRYKNVVCLDASRVVLTLNVPPETDYIHANWVKLENVDKTFIATQGPLDTTISDFWRMVHQEGVTTIFMLCKVEESGEAKCAQYWPIEQGSYQTYGCMFVNNKKVESPDSRWKSYTLEVLPEGCSNSTVTKLHQMLDWPCKGVPTSGMSVLRLLKSITPGGPCLVHCSAGIGRTGTIIAVESVLQRLFKGIPVNMKELFTQLRNQRASSIQTEGQYVFVHLCIIMYINAKMPSHSEAYNQFHDQYKATTFNEGLDFPNRQTDTKDGINCLRQWIPGTTASAFIYEEFVATNGEGWNDLRASLPYQPRHQVHLTRLRRIPLWANSFNFINSKYELHIESLPHTVLYYQLSVDIARNNLIDLSSPSNITIKSPADAACVKVGEEMLWVSKSLLGIHSPFFQALFTLDFHEKATGVYTLREIELEQFLHFMAILCDVNVPVDKNSVVYLLRLGDMYQCGRVLQRCHDYLKAVNALPPEVEITLADRYGFFSVLDTAIRSIAMDDLRAFANSSEFTQLTPLGQDLIVQRLRTWRWDCA
uniref:Protein-tyrosine-phosphatase n=1 Tax=Steinernema glaseri TaxID=37863 RepID=A0A1I7Y623_9BILA